MRRYMLPVILLLTDMLSLCLAAWLAIVVRFMDTGTPYDIYITAFFMNLPVYLACHVLFFYAFKLYNRIWKYAGIKEMLCIAGSNLCGMILYTLLRAGFRVMLDTGVILPRSMLVLCLFFNIVLIAASRLFVRWAGYQVLPPRLRFAGSRIRIIVHLLRNKRGGNRSRCSPGSPGRSSSGTPSGRTWR